MSHHLEIGSLIPGGILPTDRWHYVSDDGTCSRCGETPPDDDVPLLLWKSDDPNYMLRFCSLCMGWDTHPEEEGPE